MASENPSTEETLALQQAEGEATPEPETIEGKGDLDKEAQKSRKKKIKIKAWYNSAYFRVGVIVGLWSLTLLAMLFIDTSNTIRPKWMDVPAIRDFFGFFGIKQFDVYMTSWTLFGIVSLVGIPLLCAIVLRKPVKERRKKKRIAKNKPVDSDWSVRFDVTWWIFWVVIMVAAISAAAIAFPWQQLIKQLTNEELAKQGPVFLNVLMAVGIVLAMILAMLLALIAVFLIFRAIVKILAGMAQSIAKTMISTGDYQDFKAAAEAAAAERRREAGLSLPGDYSLLGTDALSRVDFSNLQVNVDPNKIQGMNQLVGGQRRKDEEKSDVLFPALTVIDHKWDEIYAEEERKKQEEAERLAHQEELEKAKAEYNEGCAKALREGTPAPEKPQILVEEEARIEEERRLAEEEAAKKEQEEEQETSEAPKKDTSIIGTAVQNALTEEDRKRFEEAKKNHVPMTYKDFKTLAFRFQSYLCHQKYYFPIDTIRAWIAGFSSSRLLILQGLSGTGKSTLPRVFLEYIGGKAFFFPVQATWRDRSDIVGYYSDFAGEFKETELLKHLYEASYFPDQMNIMVLDEMNISRIEYYFADFLSIFEYPPEDWLIPLMQVKLGTPVPRYIENGKVRIPTNTWFIGTANTDDSTFTITDKVYDRAIVIEFNDLNLPFTSDWDYSPYPLTMEELTTCINEAMSRKENQLTEAERTKFMKLTLFISETFDLAFGNRIMNQIDRFVPVFVALGGTKEAALDLMLARKILRKLDGHFESYVKNGLVKLSRYLQQNYGKGTLKLSEALIEKYNRKLS